MKEKQRIPIQLKEYQNEYQTAIRFDRNEIEIPPFSQEITEDYILLFPFNQNKQIEIHYFNKQWIVTQTEILALYLNEFVKKIDKLYLIKEIEIQFFDENENLMKSKEINKFQYIEMMKESLALLGFSIIFKFNKKKQTIEELHEEQYSNIIQITIEDEEYQRFASRIRKAQMILQKEHETKPIQNEQEKKLLEMDYNGEYSPTRYNEILSTLTIQQKSKLQLYQLDNYCIMIASKFFNTIDDYINIELGIKHFRGNTEKFHYNPISIYPSIREFFPYLQTLHLYSINDEQFIDDERIISRVFDHEILGEEIEYFPNYEKITFPLKYEKIREVYDLDELESVQLLKAKTFKSNETFSQIIIPSTIKSI